MNIFSAEITKTQALVKKCKSNIARAKNLRKLLEPACKAGEEKHETLLKDIYNGKVIAEKEVASLKKQLNTYKTKTADYEERISEQKREIEDFKLVENNNTKEIKDLKEQLESKALELQTLQKKQDMALEYCKKNHRVTTLAKKLDESVK